MFNLSQSKGLHSFSPVFSISSGKGSGCFIGRSVAKRKETACGATPLKSAAKKQEHRDANLKGSTMIGDGGCNDEKHFSDLASKNGHTINTMKQGPEESFVFGQLCCKTNKDQVCISESGPCTVFAAKKKTNGLDQHQVLH